MAATRKKNKLGEIGEITNTSAVVTPGDITSGMATPRLFSQQNMVTAPTTNILQPSALSAVPKDAAEDVEEVVYGGWVTKVGLGLVRIIAGSGGVNAAPNATAGGVSTQSDALPSVTMRPGALSEVAGTPFTNPSQGGGDDPGVLAAIDNTGIDAALKNPSVKEQANKYLDTSIEEASKRVEKLKTQYKKSEAILDNLRIKIDEAKKKSAGELSAGELSNEVVELLQTYEASNAKLQAELQGLEKAEKDLKETEALKESLTNNNVTEITDKLKAAVEDARAAPAPAPVPAGEGGTAPTTAQDTEEAAAEVQTWNVSNVQSLKKQLQEINQKALEARLTSIIF